MRRQLNKVFPTHWSFLLGEIALYSFIVLLITGVYLTLFFDPSMTAVTYHGVYQPLRGVEMSKAYASALDISFEVRGGLFVRQVHHWAALMFAASIMVHLARDLFHRRVPPAARSQLGHRFAAADPGDVRGLLRLLAARRPAVRNRASRALSSIMLGIPVIGTWLHWALFGGDFPGDITHSRACTGCTFCCCRGSSWR